MHIVKDLILEPEQLDIKRIMKEIQNFRYEVRRTIESGDKRYLPIASAKELDAYATPDREQSVRGALAWNVLYPDRAVELPVKLSLLKTTITSIDMLSDLQRTDPQLYTNIKTGIFEDTTGTFNRKLSNGKGIQCEGLTVLGIPLHEDIPQWIIPFVDYTTVINSVVAPFKSVTETFNMPSIEEGKTGRKTTGFSNIIKI
jgi:hypothetical protein